MFLAAAGLFLLNLAVATADRWHTRRLARLPARHGPDIIHIGVLVAAVGGLASMSERRTLAISLRLGDTVHLAGGWSLLLRDVRDQVTPSGAILDWISTVEIGHEGQAATTIREIGVHTPLRLGALEVYTTGRGTEGVIRMWEGRGLLYTLRQGELYRINDKQWRLVSVRDGEATVEQWDDNETMSTITARYGNFVGPFSLREIIERPTALLVAVTDPGRAPFLVGLAMVVIGLLWTALQRRPGDEA